MDSHYRVDRAIRCVYSLLLVIGAGCSEAVMMSQESDHGGVVTYVFKQDRGGPMGSQYRREALDAMQTKCGGELGLFVKARSRVTPVQEWARWKERRTRSEEGAGEFSSNAKESDNHDGTAVPQP